MTEKRALIVVDVQNDFCSGGALAVPRGEEVVPLINRLEHFFDLRVFTRDLHPENHCSFIEQGGNWPRHCVENTLGAELHPDLKVPDCGATFALKGTNPDKDAYSGFDGNLRLEKILREREIEEVYVCGLATDYCVKATVLDAKKFGFETYIILDACRGVNVKEGDIDRAIEEMKRSGILIINSAEIY